MTATIYRFPHRERDTWAAQPEPPREPGGFARPVVWAAIFAWVLAVYSATLTLVLTWAL